jgi:hypothetical protein
LVIVLRYTDQTKVYRVSTALEKLKQAIEEQQKLNSLFTKVIARFLFLPSNPEMGTVYNNLEKRERERGGEDVVVFLFIHIFPSFPSLLFSSLALALLSFVVFFSFSSVT